MTLTDPLKLRQYILQIAQCIWCSEIKTVPQQNWMTANVNVRKINSHVERTDDCKSSIETIIIPLNSQLHENDIFWKLCITAERISLTLCNCKDFREINTLPFKEWKTATRPVKKTDSLLKRMDGCNQRDEANRLILKNQMSKAAHPKNYLFRKSRSSVVIFILDKSVYRKSS